MKEEGIVCAVRTGEVFVKLKRHSACLGCKSCSVGTDGDMVIKAIASERVGEGDRVTVEIDSTLLVKAILLVYLLPAVGFFLGILAGLKISSLLGIYKYAEVISAFIGFAFLGLVFFFVRSYGIRRKSAYQARITEVIRSGDRPECSKPGTGLNAYNNTLTDLSPH